VYVCVRMQQDDRILIGHIYVDSKVDWENLRTMIYGIFKVSTAIVLTERIKETSQHNDPEQVKNFKTFS